MISASKLIILCILFTTSLMAEGTSVEVMASHELPDGAWVGTFGTEGYVVLNVSSEEEQGTALFTRTRAIGDSSQIQLPAYLQGPYDLAETEGIDSQLEGSFGYTGPYTVIDGRDGRVRSGLSGLVREVVDANEMREMEPIISFEVGADPPPSLILWVLVTHPEHTLAASIRVREKETVVAEATLEFSKSPNSKVMLHGFKLEKLLRGQSIEVHARPRWVQERSHSVAFIAGVLLDRVEQ